MLKSFDPSGVSIISMFVRAGECLLLIQMQFLKAICRVIRHPSRGFQAHAADWFADCCERSGGAFVKLAQLLSTRPDIISPSFEVSLRRLQDKVRPFEAAVARQIVTKNFGSEPDRVFQFFDDKPIASGSIAQVHRAKLQTGEEVAVKIRRPNIVTQVRTDLAIFSSLLRAASHIPAFRCVPLQALAQELVNLVERQLNFGLELQSCCRFIKNFEAVPNVKIPRPFVHLCTEEILVLEYIPDLRKISELHLNERDLRAAALAGLDALYQMMFRDGCIHADLHPANLFFLNGGKIVLLDFGLVTELHGHQQWEFLQFFFGLVTGRGRECARITLESSLAVAPGFSPERFESDFINLLNDFHTNTVGRFEVMGFAVSLFALQRRHGVFAATYFVSTIVALLTFEGIAKQFFPDLDFQAYARPFILRTLGFTFEADAIAPYEEPFVSKA